MLSDVVYTDDEWLNVHTVEEIIQQAPNLEYWADEHMCRNTEDKVWKIDPRIVN